jgi:hypothetical protein
VSVTVPVEPAPPVTVVGFRVSVLGIGPFTVMGAVSVVPPPVAVIVDVRVVVEAVVETVNDAAVPPAGTVTDAGTLAAAVFELDSETTSPPEGAPVLSVTTPVELLPLATVEGLSDNVDSVAGGGVLGTGSSVRVAFSVTPPPLTEIVTSVRVLTARVSMMKPPAAAN